MRGKTILLVVGILLILLTIFGVFFVKTGGVKLYSLYTNYLSKPIENKEFIWKDFTYKGVDTITSGFYAFSTKDYLCMWTFYGLKCFTVKHGSSFFEFFDVCGAVKELEAKKPSDPFKESLVNNSVEYSLNTPNFENFRDYLVSGQYLSVRDYIDNNKKWVDKGFSINNPNFPLSKIDPKKCK